MSESVEKTGTHPPQERPSRAYEPPAIAWEESFESRPGLISACGKIEASVTNCLDNGLAS